MFKTTMRFTVGGREVSLSKFGSEMEKSIKNTAEEEIKKRVESIKCPIHGEHAQVISLGRSGNNSNYNIGGCCDALKGAVQKSLG